MKKSFILLILIAAVFTGSLAKLPSQKKSGIKRVVIDAGHGGHDPGTLGKHSKEKDVALAVALKLGKLIQANFPEVQVIFTRETDVFIELYRRSQIANENRADLFISIHCNGTKTQEAHGVETWVMGLHKSQANLEVARKENASILMEDNYSQYDGFDPNSPEANIIFSLFQNVYLDQSLEMATLVQNHFQTNLGLNNRGVKQAGFWVLYKTTMPGILVETGFLSNPDDEQYLLSEKGQENIATAIFKAFSDYKGQKPMTITAETEKPRESVPEPVIVRKKETVVEPDPKVTETVTSQKKENKTWNNSIKLVENEVVYKVQIISSSAKLKDNSPKFRGLQDISFYSQKGVFKYTVGECIILKDALNLQSEMQKKGFKDAFVVAFSKGERISIEDAKKLSSR